MARETEAYLAAHPLSEENPQMSSWNGGLGRKQFEYGPRVISHPHRPFSLVSFRYISLHVCFEVVLLSRHRGWIHLGLSNVTEAFACNSDQQFAC
jgi:hypothetical protein